MCLLDAGIFHHLSFFYSVFLLNEMRWRETSVLLMTEFIQYLPAGFKRNVKVNCPNFL